MLLLQAKTLELYDTFAQAIRDGRDSSHAQRLVRCGNDAWKSYFGKFDEASWHFFARPGPYTGKPNSAFDPAPVLAEVSCPVLAIFGAEDPLVPVTKSVSIIQQALRHNPKVAIKVVANSDHGVRWLCDKTLAHGYLVRMRDWIQDAS